MTNEEIKTQLDILQANFNKLNDVFYRQHFIDKDIFSNPVYFKRAVMSVLTVLPGTFIEGELYVKNISSVRNICFYTGGVEYCAPALSSGAVIASGVYTPTRSAEANMDANAGLTECQYMRLGNTVTVSGRFTADPTLTATTTSFEITLPIASNIGAAEDVAGVAFCGNVAGMGAEVIGVAANDTAKIQWKATDVTNQAWSYHFSYQII